MRSINWYKDSLKQLNIKYNILIHNIYTDVRETYNISEEIRKQEEELKKLLKIYNHDIDRK